MKPTTIVLDSFNTNIVAKIMSRSLMPLSQYYNQHIWFINIKFLALLISCGL